MVLSLQQGGQGSVVSGLGNAIRLPDPNAPPVNLAFYEALVKHQNPDNCDAVGKVESQSVYIGRVL